MNSSTPGGAAVTAKDLALRGPRGWVYRDVRCEAPPGSLVALEGPAGSGRTCLLLTLAGRMRPTSGTAHVGGHPLPGRMAAVRAITALGPVAGVNDLDSSLTVAEHLRERILLQHRYRGGAADLLRPGRARRSAERRRRTGEALALAGLDLADLPRGTGTPVRDLSALDALRLGTALALVGRPRVLCVDNADRGLDSADRESAWLMLRTVADADITVVAACAEAPADACTVRLGFGDQAEAPGPGERAYDERAYDEHERRENKDSENTRRETVDARPANRRA